MGGGGVGVGVRIPLKQYLKQLTFRVAAPKLKMTFCKERNPTSAQRSSDWGKFSAQVFLASDGRR